MKRLIGTKVDQHEFKAFGLTKCNREDLNVLGQKLGAVQIEMTQLIVLFNKSLELNLMKGNDTRLARENRALELMS